VCVRERVCCLRVCVCDSVGGSASECVSEREIFFFYAYGKQAGYRA